MTVNLLPWWAFAAAGAVAGALLAGGVQQTRVSNAKAELAQVREQHAQAVADAALAKAAAHARALEIERELTAREQALQATIDRQDQDARHAQAQHAADARAAGAAADRLRERLATITRAHDAGARVASADAATAAGEREAASATVGVLAELYQRCDSRAGVIAEFADRAHAAGQRCERAYGSAREAMTR